MKHGGACKPLRPRRRDCHPVPLLGPEPVKAPALVIAASGPDDFILCQITSRAVRDGLEVGVEESDFRQGSLQQPSNVRPNRLFTADGRIILYKAGSLNDSTLQRVIDRLVRIVTGKD